MKSIRVIEMDENAVEPADAVCRPGPDEHSRVGVTEIDVDGYVDRKETGELPGKLVIRLPDGTKACPKCGNKLKHPHTIQYPARVGGAFAGQLITCLECTACEQPYMVKAAE